MHSKGLALLSVLFFLLLMSMFSIAALENTIMEKKSNAAVLRKMQLVAAVKQVLIQQNKVLQGCMIKPTPVSQLLAQSYASWQQSSCIGKVNGFLYYYVIESMGSDACVQLQNTSADYYRITLLMVEDQHTTVKTVLQATLALASPTKQLCAGNTRTITAGIQTLRILF